jgi:hypothetical protein
MDVFSFVIRDTDWPLQVNNINVLYTVAVHSVYREHLSGLHRHSRRHPATFLP